MNFQIRDIRFAPVLLLLIAISMLVGGAMGLYQVVLGPSLGAWQTRNWAPTQAVLDEVRLFGPNGALVQIPQNPALSTEERLIQMPTGMVRLEVRYHYYRGESMYEGARFGLYAGMDEGDALRRAAVELRRKQEIQIWVNPQDPSESLMNRDLHWGVMAMGLPLLAMVAIGGIILGHAAKAWWEMRQLAKRVRKSRQGLVS